MKPLPTFFLSIDLILLKIAIFTSYNRKFYALIILPFCQSLISHKLFYKKMWSATNSFFDKMESNKNQASTLLIIYLFFLNKKFIANIEIDFLHTGISDSREKKVVPFSLKHGVARNKKYILNQN